MKILKRTLLAMGFVAVSATAAWACCGVHIHIPKPHIPKIPIHIPHVPSLPSLPGMPGFGINIPGLGKVESFVKTPHALNMMKAGLTHVAARLSGQKVPNPAAYAAKAGGELAHQLWGDDQVKAMCTLSGEQCGPALAEMIISTASQDAGFKKSICDIFPQIGHNVKGFSLGFNRGLYNNIVAHQKSLKPNADFSKLGCN